MSKVVVIGGGWAGCAAAISAKKAGADVVIAERTDMLLGTGLVGGIMRNNGRFTAAEEMIAMGGGDLFGICDNNSRHTNVEFPGHSHASLYDIAKTHGAVLKYIRELGIEVLFKSRIVRMRKDNSRIIHVEDNTGRLLKGDAFIEATGTAGPPKNCTKYGNGCVMCIIRCPTFGGRVSIAKMAGVKEYVAKKPDGSYGAMSGSCKLYKESLSNEIQDELNRTGVAIIPVPEELREDHRDIKACQQYTSKEFNENIILLDTGHAKLMTAYFDLEALRSIPGFENARYEDPYSGGIGNSMRYLAMAPRDDYLRVMGVDNLFCCGEKAGPLVGHTEAIVTGTLAGCNGTRLAAGIELLRLPRELAVGDAISYVGEQMTVEGGISRKYTFSGSIYFERMKNLSLYSLDIEFIKGKVHKAGLDNVFSEKIV